MKKKFEIDMSEDIYSIIDELTLNSLLDSIKILQKNPCNIPFFEVDPKKEAKAVKKLIKSFKQVISWYSVPGSKYYEK